MSSLLINEQPKKFLRIKKVSNPYKIRIINNPNIENYKNIEKNIPKKIKFYKKVLVKPFTSRNKDNFNKSNNIGSINKNNDNSKQERHSLNDKMYLTKNDDLIKSQNKANIDNNYLKNVITKIPRRKCKNIFININDEYNYIKNNENCFNFNLSKSINDNNKERYKNKTENVREKRNNYQRKKGNEIREIFIDKNNIFINNDLNLNFSKDKEKNLNINYINSISNDIYKNNNSPLSNSMHDHFNISYSTIGLSNIENKQTIKKYTKKAILLDDKDYTINNNKSNNIINPTYNYIYPLTEINPYSKFDEIERSSLKNNVIREKEQFNTIKNTQRIISLIDKRKQKLLNDNYMKYIKLIQKQQEKYKEYEQFLKKELKRNKNSQKNLELIKENYISTMKNSFTCKHFENFPSGTKTLSSKNINKQSYKNKFIKNKLFSLNNLNNKIQLGKDNLNQISGNRSMARNIIEREIQIKENILKRKTKNKISKKTNKITNKINITNPNPNIFRNNKSNIYHLNITLKPIINTDRSLNYEIKNYSFENKVFKNTKNKLLYNYSDNVCTKAFKRDNGKNKIMLRINNTGKNIILKKLVNKAKNEIARKSKIKSIKINKDLKEFFKSISLQKFKIVNRYYYESNNLKDTNNKKKELTKRLLKI